jgi:hypothetical protein
MAKVSQLIKGLTTGNVTSHIDMPRNPAIDQSTSGKRSRGLLAAHSRLGFGVGRKATKSSQQHRGVTGPRQRGARIRGGGF